MMAWSSEIYIESVNYVFCDIVCDSFFLRILRILLCVLDGKLIMDSGWLDSVEK
jgi:hypothetical protein